jgi:hypothetical protein
MLRSRGLRQWTVFAAVFVLLLKAAVPLFASTAASLQGVSVAEVCTVYGVRMVALDATQADEHALGIHPHHHDGDGGPGSGSQLDGSHGGNHCALTALAALAPQETEPIGLSHTGSGSAPQPADSRPSIHDAAAAWAARLWHGPPAGRSSNAA